jgi:hypothetical protein
MMSFSMKCTGWHFLYMLSINCHIVYRRLKHSPYLQSSNAQECNLSKHRFQHMPGKELHTWYKLGLKGSKLLHILHMSLDYRTCKRDS